MDHTASLRALARARWRVAMALSLVVVIAYFAFILAIAFDPALMSVRLVPGLSLGILAGAGVIVIAWGTTWFYVHWANRHMDGEITRMRGDRS